MYFKTPDDAASAVAGMAESIYNKRHLLNCMADQEILMDFRVGIVDRDVICVVVVRGQNIWYTIGDKLACQYEPGELVFDYDENEDFQIRSSSYRRYIFQDLMVVAVKDAIDKIYVPHTYMSVSDSFPFTIRKIQGL